ncbi:hypothetical protein ACFLUU_06695 [Chloroflexota bacterium]
MVNPYSKIVLDEALGIEVESKEYEVFEEGRREGAGQVVDWLEKHNVSPFALTIAELFRARLE